MFLLLLLFFVNEWVKIACSSFHTIMTSFKLQMVPGTGRWPCWQEKHLSGVKRCMLQKIVGCPWTSKAATWESTVSLLPVWTVRNVVSVLVILNSFSLHGELVTNQINLNLTMQYIVLWFHFSVALYGLQKNSLDFYILLSWLGMLSDATRPPLPHT